MFKAPEKGWPGSRAERAIRSKKPFFQSKGVARQRNRKRVGCKAKCRAMVRQARKDFYEQLVKKRETINVNVFNSIGRKKAARGSAGPGSNAGLRGMFKGCDCVAEEQTEFIALVISVEVLEEVLTLAHLRSGHGVDDPS